MLPLQEEERERRMDFVPDVSAINTEAIEVRQKAAQTCRPVVATTTTATAAAAAAHAVAKAGVGSGAAAPAVQWQFCSPAPKKQCGN